jgi:hypothetical protein
MTRCVKGSEFSHLELSMLRAGKLIDHVMPAIGLANSPVVDLVPMCLGPCKIYPKTHGWLFSMYIIVYMYVVYVYFASFQLAIR